MRYNFKIVYAFDTSVEMWFAVEQFQEWMNESAVI